MAEDEKTLDEIVRELFREEGILGDPVPLTIPETLELMGFAADDKRGVAILNSLIDDGTLISDRDEALANRGSTAKKDVRITIDADSLGDYIQSTGAQTQEEFAATFAEALPSTLGTKDFKQVLMEDHGLSSGEADRVMNSMKDNDTAIKEANRWQYTTEGVADRVATFTEERDTAPMGTGEAALYLGITTDELASLRAKGEVAVSNVGTAENPRYVYDQDSLDAAAFENTAQVFTDDPDFELAFPAEMTLSEAASFAGISTDKMKDLIASGEILGTQDPDTKRWSISRDSIAEFAPGEGDGFSTGDAAEYLAVSSGEITKLRQAGELEAANIGTPENPRYSYRQEDLDALGLTIAREASEVQEKAFPDQMGIGDATDFVSAGLKDVGLKGVSSETVKELIASGDIVGGQDPDTGVWQIDQQSLRDWTASEVDRQAGTFGTSEFAALVKETNPDLTDAQVNRFVQDQKDVGAGTQPDGAGTAWVFDITDIETSVGDFVDAAAQDANWVSAGDISDLFPGAAQTGFARDAEGNVIGPGAETRAITGEPGPGGTISAGKVAREIKELNFFGDPSDPDNPYMRVNDRGQVEYWLPAVEQLYDAESGHFLPPGVESPEGLTRGQITAQMRADAPDMLVNPTGATKTPASEFWKKFNSDVEVGAIEVYEDIWGDKRYIFTGEEGDSDPPDWLQIQTPEAEEIDTEERPTRPGVGPTSDFQLFNAGQDVDDSLIAGPTPIGTGGTPFGLGADDSDIPTGTPSYARTEQEVFQFLTTDVNEGGMGWGSVKAKNYLERVDPKFREDRDGMVVYTKDFMYVERMNGVQNADGTEKYPVWEPPISPLAEIPATVTEVIDGDTVRLSNGQTVRITGFDSPEIGETGWSEGRDITTAFFDTLGNDVTLLWDGFQDIYGRPVVRLVQQDVPVPDEFGDIGDDSTDMGLKEWYAFNPIDPDDAGTETSGFSPVDYAAVDAAFRKYTTAVKEHNVIGTEEAINEIAGFDLSEDDLASRGFLPFANGAQPTEDLKTFQSYEAQYTTHFFYDQYVNNVGSKTLEGQRLEREAVESLAKLGYNDPEAMIAEPPVVDGPLTGELNSVFPIVIGSGTDREFFESLSGEKLPLSPEEEFAKRYGPVQNPIRVPDAQAGTGESMDRSDFVAYVAAIDSNQDIAAKGFEDKWAKAGINDPAQRAKDEWLADANPFIEDVKRGKTAWRARNIRAEGHDRRLENMYYPADRSWWTLKAIPNNTQRNQKRIFPPEGVERDFDIKEELKASAVGIAGFAAATIGWSITKRILEAKTGITTVVPIGNLSPVGFAKKLASHSLFKGIGKLERAVAKFVTHIVTPATEPILKEVIRVESSIKRYYDNFPTEVDLSGSPEGLRLQQQLGVAQNNFDNSGVNERYLNNMREDAGIAKVERDPFAPNPARGVTRPDGVTVLPDGTEIKPVSGASPFDTAGSSARLQNRIVQLGEQGNKDAFRRWVSQQGIEIPPNQIDRAYNVFNQYAGDKALDTGKRPNFEQWWDDATQPSLFGAEVRNPLADTNEIIAQRWEDAERAASEFSIANPDSDLLPINVEDELLEARKGAFDAGLMERPDAVELGMADTIYGPEAVASDVNPQVTPLEATAREKIEVPLVDDAGKQVLNADGTPQTQLVDKGKLEDIINIPNRGARNLPQQFDDFEKVSGVKFADKEAALDDFILWNTEERLAGKGDLSVERWAREQFGEGLTPDQSQELARLTEDVVGGPVVDAEPTLFDQPTPDVTVADDVTVGGAADVADDFEFTFRTDKNIIGHHETQAGLGVGDFKTKLEIDPGTGRPKVPLTDAEFTRLSTIAKEVDAGRIADPFVFKSTDKVNVFDYLDRAMAGDVLDIQTGNTMPFSELPDRVRNSFRLDPEVDFAIDLEAGLVAGPDDIDIRPGGAIDGINIPESLADELHTTSLLSGDDAAEFSRVVSQLSDESLAAARALQKAGKLNSFLRAAGKVALAIPDLTDIVFGIPAVGLALEAGVGTRESLDVLDPERALAEGRLPEGQIAFTDSELQFGLDQGIITGADIIKARAGDVIRPAGKELLPDPVDEFGFPAGTIVAEVKQGIFPLFTGDDPFQDLAQAVVERREFQAEQVGQFAGLDVTPGQRVEVDKPGIGPIIDLSPGFASGLEDIPTERLVVTPEGELTGITTDPTDRGLVEQEVARPVIAPLAQEAPLELLDVVEPDAPTPTFIRPELGIDELVVGPAGPVVQKPTGPAVGLPPTPSGIEVARTEGVSFTEDPSLDPALLFDQTPRLVPGSEVGPRGSESQELGPSPLIEFDPRDIIAANVPIDPQPFEIPRVKRPDEVVDVQDDIVPVSHLDSAGLGQRFADRFVGTPPGTPVAVQPVSTPSPVSEFTPTPTGTKRFDLPVTDLGATGSGAPGERPAQDFGIERIPEPDFGITVIPPLPEKPVLTPVWPNATQDVSGPLVEIKRPFRRRR